MTPAARTFKGSILFCPRGQIPRARRGQTHAPFPHVSLRGNIIPAYRVETALTTAFFYTFILFTGIYLIGLFEPSDADFLEISFEAASALATAGLTSGILSEISIGSKITLIILMYIGRVGVITFGNAILIHSKRSVSEKNNDMVV